MNKKRNIKVLQICGVDYFIKFLLKPLIDCLIKENYDVTIACSSGEYEKWIKKGHYKVKAIKLKKSIYSVSNLLSLFKLYMLMRKERFDIVHVHNPMASAMGRIAARIASVKSIIYTAHGFYFHENMPFLKRRFYILVEKILGRYFTDVIFTQSREDMSTAIKESLIPRKKIIWIGNGVNIKEFRRFKKFRGAVLGVKERDKVICFVGRIVKEKGIVELVYAFKRVVEKFPEAKLLIVGKHLGSDRDKRIIEVLENIIKENHLEEFVIFAGLREDIPKIFSIIDVFVLPSHREGMPRSIIEAMAAGKPVVATNIRGCREEVINGKTGILVPVNNANKLAKAIIKILSDKKLALKMGKNARRIAIERFNEEDVLRRQLDVYKHLRIP